MEYILPMFTVIFICWKNSFYFTLKHWSSKKQSVIFFVIANVFRNVLQFFLNDWQEVQMNTIKI